MKCIVVDDEPLALDLLESYVRKTPFLELAGKYSSAVQAMKELANQQVDLIFLDIQMPELAKAHLLPRLPAGRQQSPAPARTDAPHAPRRNRQHLREKRIQTGADRTAENPLRRRAEGLHQDLRRRQPQARTVTDEHESHGRPPAPLAVHARAPLLHCPQR